MTGLGELAATQPLLMVVIAAIIAAAAGWMIEHERPGLGIALRRSGYLAMLAAGLLLVGQLAAGAKNSDAALLISQHPKLEVRGGETVVPMASDGHYWVEARVNGKPGWFLIDTGATFTGLTPTFAEEADVKPDPHQLPVELDTANGPITARIGNIDEMRFGNIVVNNLEAAISPVRDEGTNLIGMNLLSRLATWRVEGDKLVLEPKR